MPAKARLAIALALPVACLAALAPSAHADYTYSPYLQHNGIASGPFDIASFNSSSTSSSVAIQNGADLTTVTFNYSKVTGNPLNSDILFPIASVTLTTTAITPISYVLYYAGGATITNPDGGASSSFGFDGKLFLNNISTSGGDVSSLTTFLPSPSSKTIGVEPFTFNIGDTSPDSFFTPPVINGAAGSFQAQIIAGTPVAATPLPAAAAATRLRRRRNPA
jgi:hypothetical protein